RFPTDVTDSFLHGCDAAQFHSCSAHGLLPAQPRAHLLFYGTLQEFDEFIVQLLFPARPPKQVAKPADEAPDERHQITPGEASRILAMAVVCVCQSRVARLRYARPCVLSM